MNIFKISIELCTWLIPIGLFTQPLMSGEKLTRKHTELAKSPSHPSQYYDHVYICLAILLTEYMCYHKVGLGAFYQGLFLFWGGIYFVLKHNKSNFQLAQE